MLLLLVPGHLYYVETELRDPAEGDLWTTALPRTVASAVTVATILVLAVSRPAAEYLPRSPNTASGPALLVENWP